MIFYTSDLHINHKNIIKYSKRPFENEETMQSTIRKNWNAVVTKDDDVYIIGDVFFSSAEKKAEQIKYLNSLNGKKHLITGNHDKKLAKDPDWAKLFVSIQDYAEIVDNGRHVILFHYPILEWNGFFKGYYHIYGHIHNNYDTMTYKIINQNRDHFKNAFNAGTDENDFFPKTLSQFINEN